ncbi:MAG: DNA-processing protein DprA [Alphaproteobacteria bacterium]|nr:DNA-processing protein DprA [Alphaproteobacteria bacterium]
MAASTDIINALRLISTSGIGAVGYYRLVAEHGSEQAALDALAAIGQTFWSIERAKQEMELCAAKDIKILLYTDHEYPSLLKNINDYPPILYVKGNPQALNLSRNIAIVGSRAASSNGCRIAARIAEELAEQQIGIISGMARGIDSAAHCGALTAKDGLTVAVLGTGVDVVYPSENQNLYEQIAEHGCVISEFPLGTSGIAANFPRRNRIIAGLSQGVLVVEAGLKSGSLITADYAIRQGKMLFAVPGTPDVTRSSGSNFLIKKGAVLADCAADILSALKRHPASSFMQNSQAQQKVLVFANNDVKFSKNEKKNNIDSPLAEFLTVDGVEIDELIRLTGQNPSAVAAQILELELGGIIRRTSGNKIALIK